MKIPQHLAYEILGLAFLVSVFFNHDGICFLIGMSFLILGELRFQRKDKP